MTRATLLLLLVASCGSADDAVMIDGAGGDSLPADDARADGMMMIDARPSDAPPTDAPAIDARPVDARIDAPPGKRVFVTRLRYPADLRTAGGGSDGLAAGDRICQTHADAAGLGGTFQAWLSTSTVDAIDHITGTGPWYRMDGALAFPNRATLSTTPLVPLIYDEVLGQPTTFYEVWTGTGVGGRRAPLGNRQSVTCLDWTSTIDSAVIGGMVGTHGPIDSLPGNGPEWTQYAVGYCSPYSRHLYCFER